MDAICEPSACTGCRACESICPKGAIHFDDDERGFKRPVIDANVCVNCYACERVCVVHQQNLHAEEGRVYACWSKNKNKRRQSTSGGAFRLLAEAVLEEGGVVYGAAFDKNMVVRHIRVLDKEGLMMLVGSKYVQSDVRDCYQQAKHDLIDGKTVLFSGVACQIAALKNYLGRPYDNLLCVDAVCHGVPSPLVFKDYVKFLSDKFESFPSQINFRYKKPGWTVFSMRVVFESGKVYQATKFKDPFLNFFLGDLILRPSCHECRFTQHNRTGDITLADFWKYQADSFKKRGTEKGVNLLIINSKIGEKWFSKIQDAIFFEEKNWCDAESSNKSFTEPWAVPARAERFWKDYGNCTFEQMAGHYSIPAKKEEFTARRRAWQNAHKYMLPDGLLNILRKIKAKCK